MAWRELITRNFGWKLASVVLATLLWFMLRSSDEGRAWGSERILRHCEITVMTAASDDHAFRVEPSHVTVVVSGTDQQLQSLKPSDVDVYVNLTTILEANGLRKRVQVFTPPGIQVVRTTPSEVTITSLPVPIAAVPPASRKSTPTPDPKRPGGR